MRGVWCPLVACALVAALMQPGVAAAAAPTPTASATTLVGAGHITALSIKPSTSGKTALAGGDVSGIFGTTTSGQSWAAQNQRTSADKPGQKQLQVASFAWDPASTSRVFAGTAAGLQVSTDSGQTWTMVPGIPPDLLHFSLDKPFFGQDTSGVCGPGGCPGFQFPASPKPARSVGKLLAFQGTQLYAGTFSGGIFPASSTGWNPASEGLSYGDALCAATAQYCFIRSLVPDPNNADLLYAAVYNVGIVRVSIATGTETLIWSSGSKQPEELMFKGSDLWCACGPDGVYVSSNASAGSPTFTAKNSGLRVGSAEAITNGTSWTTIAGGGAGTDPLFIGAMNPVNNVPGATTGCYDSVMRSTNAGGSWSSITSSSTTSYACNVNFKINTSSGGARWWKNFSVNQADIPTALGAKGFDASSMVVNGSCVWISGSGGIYRTADGTTCTGTATTPVWHPFITGLGVTVIEGVVRSANSALSPPPLEVSMRDSLFVRSLDLSTFDDEVFNTTAGAICSSSCNDGNAFAEVLQSGTTFTYIAAGTPNETDPTPIFRTTGATAPTPSPTKPWPALLPAIPGTPGVIGLLAVVSAGSQPTLVAAATDESPGTASGLYVCSGCSEANGGSWTSIPGAFPQQTDGIYVAPMAQGQGYTYALDRSANARYGVLWYSTTPDVVASWHSCALPQTHARFQVDAGFIAADSTQPGELWFTTPTGLYTVDVSGTPTATCPQQQVAGQTATTYGPIVTRGIGGVPVLFMAGPAVLGQNAALWKLTGGTWSNGQFSGGAWTSVVSPILKGGAMYPSSITAIRTGAAGTPYTAFIGTSGDGVFQIKNAA